MPYCDKFSKKKKERKIPGAAVEQNMPSVALNKWSFPKHSSVRSVCMCACVCARACMHVYVCFKLLFVLCKKKFFYLGDSGCEFDARQLWLKTFAWSIGDH